MRRVTVDTRAAASGCTPNSKYPRFNVTLAGEGTCKAIEEAAVAVNNVHNVFHKHPELEPWALYRNFGTKLFVISA